MMVKDRIILVVRDGWGYSDEKRGNATYLAYTPNNDFYLENYPWTLLNCTGSSVGLPNGTQGGSEPAHLIMGAGRIVSQPLEIINRNIREGGFYEKKEFLDSIDYCKSTGGKIHLAGLFSDQGIHGHINHLFAILEICRRNEFRRVFIHAFLDGRDVPERSAKKFFRKTHEVIQNKKVGVFASIIGRYYAMDRDKNWDRTEIAYNLLTIGTGKKEENPIEALEHVYESSCKITDYYIEPIVLTNKFGQPIALVDEGDCLILWNFRSDRARQITYALTDRSFSKFKRVKFPKIHYVCMSEYDKKIDLPVVFPHKKVQNNLSSILSKNHLNQLRIAETEKYAHVTFFFNSQIEEPNAGEHRILVPSLKIPSYEEKPEMSANEITEKLLTEIKKEYYDFILVNYANGDLVGHSANLKAGIKACEVVDECLGKVVSTGLTKKYTIIVTGDHGNIETMFYPNGDPNPSHGTNPVPFILISDNPTLFKCKLKTGKGISSISPTILDIMGLNKPKEMTSTTLIER
jgi:2,3-bisphosphoglycerate-independent phosphoglycerate mutase